MKQLLFLSLVLLFASCTSSNQSQEKEASTSTIKQIDLTLAEATRLAELPFHCITTEYPNKLGQTLGGDENLQSPKELHPAFYGCFDWHSSVHGHWSLVRILNKYPNIANATEIKEKLSARITKANIAKEIAYFDDLNKSFERTYGWAWLLKLQQELDASAIEEMQQLGTNLQPLTNHIVENYITYLPKLVYPIRVGEHSNTAFGLSFAYDYAKASKNIRLQQIIETTAKRFYQNDKDCPITWEPSGYDFLSPCLQEAFLMSKILPKQEFKPWLQAFLPQLSSTKFELPVGLVGDRTDSKLVHLDGVNYSRAWCLNGIANTLPEEYPHLKQVANEHINHSLPSIVDGNYEGTHWLASFALYALDNQ